MIKKFKNGKILLKPDSIEDIKNESFYHDEMFMANLYFDQINGYMYIVDYNSSLVYYLGSHLLQNPLQYLLEELEERGKMYLYPLTRKESQSLLQDLENGY